MMPIKGSRNAMATNSTSPAKMLPKRRKVKLMILATSLMASRRPTNNPMGPCLKLTNLPMWPKKPSVENPQKWIMVIATRAMANVVFTSVLALRRKGTSRPACCPSFTPCSSTSSAVIWSSTEPNTTTPNEPSPSNS